MNEAPITTKSLQVERPMGKVEQAKAKIKKMPEGVKKLLNRLKAKAEDKPQEVLEEVEKIPQEIEVLVSDDATKKKAVDKKILTTPPPQISEANEKKDIPVSYNLVTKKRPFYERALLKIMSPERSSEILASWIMEGLEIYHESILNPGKPLYKVLFSTTQPENMPQLPKDQVTRWAVDHIGDIWEISAGFTAMRLGFVAANEVLKKIPAAKGYQIPDEACFWASLASTVTVKAAHSLGYISLFGIHDHMANPVPEMLFGQGVAAVVLAASHYAGKYNESVKDLASRGITKLFSKLDPAPDVAQVTMDDVS
jgi:hypothetical protein